MTVDKAKLVDLFVALGCSTAAKWNDERLVSKAGTISKIYDKQELTKGQKTLYKEIVAAQKANEDLELVAGEPAAAGTPKPKKKDKAAKTDDSDVEGEDTGTEEASENKEDKPAKKDKKAKAPKKAGEGKGPGVIGSIIEFLEQATSSQPLSKADCLEKLCARFPDRDREGMQKTIGIQLPSRIRKEKGLDIEKNEHGYYVGVAAKPKKDKAKKSKGDE